MLTRRKRWRISGLSSNYSQSKNPKTNCKIKNSTLFQIGFGLKSRCQKETGCFILPFYERRCRFQAALHEKRKKERRI